MKLLFLLVNSVFVLGLSAAPAKSDNVLYFSIISTETPGLEFISKHKKLNRQFTNLSLVSSNDCLNLKPNLILFVSELSKDKVKTNSALSKAKELIPDSYFRECKVRPGSLLFYKLPFIHKSILNLPDDTINWSFEMTRSELIRLDKDVVLLTEKKYNGDLFDGAQGSVQPLYVLDNISTKLKTILPRCEAVANVSRYKKKISFHCTTSVAGLASIHTVYVYDIPSDKITFEKNYCQKAKLKSNSRLSCFEESVNQFGEIKLEKREFDILK